MLREGADESGVAGWPPRSLALITVPVDPMEVDAVLAGSLTEFSLPDVFSLLAATRKTGALHLTGHEASGRIWILGGALAFAAADVTRAPLVARLLHGGEIETTAVESLVRAHATQDGAEVSQALATAGIAGDRITQLLHDQTIDAVFDLSRWTGGQFAFDAAAAPAETEAPTVAAPEVLEAVGARIAEWEGIVAQLPSPASVLRPVSRPVLHPGGMVQMSAAQWEVFTLVDGVRTVSDLIVLTGQGQFVVARLLAGLVAEGLVAVTEGSGTQTLSEQRARHLSEVERRILGAIAPVEVPDVVVPAVHLPRPPAPLVASHSDGTDVAGAAGAAGAAGEAPDADRADEGTQVDVTDSTLDVDALLHPTRERVPASGTTAPADARAAARNGDQSDGRKAGSDLLARLIDGVKGA